MTGYLFLLPAALLILVMNFYPILQAVIISFKSGVSTHMMFVGVKNYLRLLEDRTLHKALFNVFFYLILNVPIMLLLSLFLANLLNSPDIKFKGFFRTALFLPCATSLVSSAIIFRSLFATEGFINGALTGLGIISTNIDWLGHEWLARIIIVLAVTWRWAGYNMVFFLAGLQGIDPTIYEAAEIDGASKYQSFFKITIPLLSPIILLTSIMATSGLLQLFDEPKNITNGGPANATLSVSQYIYNTSFVMNPNFGYAACCAVFLFLMVAVLTWAQLKIGDQK